MASEVSHSHPPSDEATGPISLNSTLEAPSTTAQQPICTPSSSTVHPNTLKHDVTGLDRPLIETTPTETAKKARKRGGHGKKKRLPTTIATEATGSDTPQDIAPTSTQPGVFVASQMKPITLMMPDGSYEDPLWASAKAAHIQERNNQLRRALAGNQKVHYVKKADATVTDADGEPATRGADASTKALKSILE